MFLTIAKVRYVTARCSVEIEIVYIIIQSIQTIHLAFFGIEFIT